jgi:hypothetical protein
MNLSVIALAACNTLRKALVVVVPIALCLAILAGHPASAQPTIADASTYTMDSSGNLNIQVAVYIAVLSYSETVDIAQEEIPGAVASYTDCNCTPQSFPVSGDWAFSYSWDSNDGEDWYADLWWVLYSPSISYGACSVCSNCSNPQTEAAYLEYYTTVEEESFEIVFY